MRVNTEPELRAAGGGRTSGTSILIAAGTYQPTNTLHVRGEVKNVALRGATGALDRVRELEDCADELGRPRPAK